MAKYGPAKTAHVQGWAQFPFTDEVVPPGTPVAKHQPTQDFPNGPWFNPTTTGRGARAPCGPWTNHRLETLFGEARSPPEGFLLRPVLFQLGALRRTPTVPPPPLNQPTPGWPFGHGTTCFVSSFHLLSPMPSHSIIPFPAFCPFFGVNPPRFLQKGICPIPGALPARVGPAHRLVKKGPLTNLPPMRGG